MLKLKYLYENYNLAKEALENWEHDDARLDEMLAQFRISSNAIYPFYQQGKVCFLRLAPVEEKQEKNLLGEIAFIKYLQEHNYPALKLIQTSTGEDCLKIFTQWGEYYATAFIGVKGVKIGDTDMTKEIMYEYGKALGRLHSLSAEFAPKIKKWTHIEVLHWIEGVLAEYNAPKGIAVALAELRDALELLPLQRESYGLIHYDFELDNVFYDQETSACSVIDFDDGMYHFYGVDILKALDSLEDELCGEALQTAQNEFLRGYQSEHSYTPEMESSFPLMRRFTNLYTYARLIRCVSEQFEDEPQWMKLLRKKLGNIIAQKEADLLKS